MDEALLFNHPEADATVTWLGESTFQVVWIHKETGIHAGNLLGEFKDIPHPETGEPVPCVIFHTLWLHERLQARGVLRFLRKRLAPWCRKRGVRWAIIPRPDGGGALSESIFEQAGFEKDGVYGRRVADLTPDSDGLSLTERRALAEERAAGLAPADTR